MPKKYGDGAGGYLKKLVGDKLRQPRSRWGDDATDQAGHRDGDLADPATRRTDDIPPPLVRDEPLPSTPMDSRYDGEHDPDNWHRWCEPDTVHYMDAEEREAHRLFVRDGRFYRASDGEPYSSIMEPVPGFEIDLGDYVVDPHGNMYVLPLNAVALMHHSSALAGERVAGAGELTIRDGKLLMINDGSGHYKPTPAMLRRVVQELERQGVDVSDVRVEEGSW